MSNARETIALRNQLQTHMRHEDLRAVHWPTVITAASPALDRGWTGDELARWCIADLGNAVDNAGAIVVTTLRELGKTDPPRDVTPTPPPMSEHRRALQDAQAAAQGVDHTAWAARIKTGKP